MNSLTIDLEHCYGIKKLQENLDFGNGSVQAVYAPNGMMKTSLANTFRDLSQGSKSVDRIWSDRETRRIIVDENGDELMPETIFVIEPYRPDYHSDRISTLMVNDKLRMRYEEIHKEIDAKTEDLVKVLKPLTGIKDGIKEQFAQSIALDSNDFFRALGRVKDEVEQDPDGPLGDVIYSHIFNPKVETVLNDPKFREKIRDYVEKYDELVSKSTFFRKGIFTHNNAADIAKSLNTNGFFKAEHSVYLRINGEKREVGSLQELEVAIHEEKTRILTDADLKAAFEAMDKILGKNVELKTFRQCLVDHPALITELNNPEKLKQRLWIAYLVRTREPYTILLDAFNAGKEQIAKIVEEARHESTRWAEVINIFNERFSVPFVVRMGNKEDVILKSEAPSPCFDFLEDVEDKESPTIQIEEKSLIDILSNGEKRALYILNIIFEVEARKSLPHKTLFVVDDIADSFDYKNKYAIIEYLKDMSSEPKFRLLILSHNFDFFRTIAGRLNIDRSKLLTAIKDRDVIKLQKQFYNDPFTCWRKKLSTNNIMLIASIPFLRNLAQYSGDHDSYEKLTALLHMKPVTEKIVLSDLETLIKKILHDQASLSLANANDSVKKLIYKCADDCIHNSLEQSDLEVKVVLAIAIRLKAEEFMLQKINDMAFWEGIRKNQTLVLVERFKSDFSTEKAHIKLLDQVNLMTPENIHLNSFMYEPLLDMAAEHLKKLYKNVTEICQNNCLN